MDIADIVENYVENMSIINSYVYRYTYMSLHVIFPQLVSIINVNVCYFNFKRTVSNAIFIVFHRENYKINMIELSILVLDISWIYQKEDEKVNDDKFASCASS